MMDVCYWRLPGDERNQFWLESHRVVWSITAADNISASTLTPHGERGVATGELERN